MTVTTNTSKPFNSNSVAYFEVSYILCARTEFDDLAYAFVAAYLSCWCGEGEGFPGVGHDA
jgi:hypothetical protein